MTVAIGLVEVESGLLHGLAAQRVSLRCPHGGSTFFLLPARSGAADQAAIDFVWAQHVGRHGCECVRLGLNARGGRLS